jgi:hypothetical protein
VRTNVVQLRVGKRHRGIRIHLRVEFREVYCRLVLVLILFKEQV